MRDPPRMPQLQEYPPAGGMHTLCHQAPGRHLTRFVNAGGIEIADAIGRSGRFRNDQSRTRPLGVVVRCHRRGEAAGRPVPGHRRHDDPVGLAVRKEPRLKVSNKFIVIRLKENFRSGNVRHGTALGRTSFSPPTRKNSSVYAALRITRSGQ